MEKHKIISFIDTLTQKTINQSQKWQFATGQRTWEDVPNVDKGYAYVTETKQGSVFIASDGYNATEYTLLIKPKNAPFYDSSELIPWTNSNLRREYNKSLQKLHNSVYQSLPNPDSFIDGFLDE